MRHCSSSGSKVCSLRGLRKEKRQNPLHLGIRTIPTPGVEVEEKDRVKRATERVTQGYSQRLGRVEKEATGDRNNNEDRKVKGAGTKGQQRQAQK